MLNDSVINVLKIIFGMSQPALTTSLMLCLLALRM